MPEGTPTELPGIATLWIGARLSFLEQFCLKSFADRGHRVRLYAYDEIADVPEGIELADAATIMPARKSTVHPRSLLARLCDEHGIDPAAAPVES